MSTGIGKTQQRILDVLKMRYAASDGTPKSEAQYGKTSVVHLAKALGLRDNQVRRAVHSLASRGLVVLTKEPGGWKGVGEYGPLVDRDKGYWNNTTSSQMDFGPEVPSAGTRRVWSWDYDDEGKRYRRFLNIEQVHTGMPTGTSLFVYTPEAHTNRQSMLDAFRLAFLGG